MALAKLTKADETMELLCMIVRPVRMPTLRWLLSDYFSITDFMVNGIISNLLSHNRVTIDNGGWVRVQR